MQIIFTDLFKKESQKFGFRETHVKNAIDQKDEMERVSLDEKVLVFISKKIETENTKFYWLIGGEGQRDKLIIYFALRIYPQLIDNIEELSPLGILRKFIDVFGYELIIGEKKSKFFVKESIYANTVNPAEVIKMNTGDSTNFSSNFMLKMNPAPRGGLIVDIALAYCFDTEKYLEHLRGK